MTGRTPGPPPDDGVRALRLVVLGESTAFTDEHGPQLPDAPHLYPNVTARLLAERLGREVEVATIGRAAMTADQAWDLVTRDRHAMFEVLAGCDAVVVGVGSFDHAPGGWPAPLTDLAGHLRPPALRRRVKRGLHTTYPWVVRATAWRTWRTPRSVFTDRFDKVLLQVRGLAFGAAGVVLGPTSHRSAYYAHRHPQRVAGEALHLSIARAHGFATVPAWELVEPHADALNPDGIHWPAPAHVAVAEALAAALAPQLTGHAPRPPRPGVDEPIG
ncbi:MAG: hypothetical protein ACLGIR_12710 [Actinomycetes bacterium]